MITMADTMRVHGIMPELLLGIYVMHETFAKHFEDLHITSVIDGQHMRASIHYIGGAADFRLPPAGKRNAIEMDARKALGPDYDLVTEVDHWHLEFQPKTGY